MTASQLLTLSLGGSDPPILNGSNPLPRPVPGNHVSRLPTASKSAQSTNPIIAAGFAVSIRSACSICASECNKNYRLEIERRNAFRHCSTVRHLRGTTHFSTSPSLYTNLYSFILICN